MKKFAISVLSISVFFVGLGSLAEHVGARFKSDEKALDIVRKARTAVGGDVALAGVRSMIITGRTTHSVKIDGAERSESGETEIAMQLPDKLMKMTKIGKDDGSGDAHKLVEKRVDVVVARNDKDGTKTIGNGEGRGISIGTEPGVKKVIVKTGDGEEISEVEADKVVVLKESDGNGAWKSKDGRDKHMTFSRSAHPGMHEGMKHNELLRLSLALLLSAPEGIDVNYTFAGESDVDGTAVNIVNAEFGGSNYKLFISKSSNLPVAMSCREMSMPMIVKFAKDGPSANAARDHLVFEKKLDSEAETTENFVKFSDYRSTGGVQLPYKWTTIVDGNVRETFEVSTYDINPSNIEEKFQNQKVFVRTKKVEGQ